MVVYWRVDGVDRWWMLGGVDGDLLHLYYTIHHIIIERFTSGLGWWCSGGS